MHLDDDDGPDDDPELGPRQRLTIMQQLFDVDAASLLLPAYVQRDDGAPVVQLQDAKGFRSLLDISDLDWRHELHLLCMTVNATYSALWIRQAHSIRMFWQ